MLVSVVLYADVPSPVVEQQHPEIRSDSPLVTQGLVYGPFGCYVDVCATGLLIFPVVYEGQSVAVCLLVVPQ